MSLSFCPFFYVLVRLYVLSQLYPQSYLICICSFFSTFMSFTFWMCSDGLGVRVEDSKPRGQWFDSLLEQFVLKTREVNSILGNRNMIGKIPTWWENSDMVGKFRHGGKIPTVGIGKRPEKIPLWWEISLSGRKKVFRCMDHLVLRHPSYMRGFTYPFSLSVGGTQSLAGKGWGSQFRRPARGLWHSLHSVITIIRL